MTEYLSPGVYIEEFDSGVKPMEGVATSTSGFIGMTQRGKITGVPEFVGSYGEFQRKFGGYLPKEVYKERRYLPMAVEQFFANGGSRCHVVRLLDEKNAASASKTVAGITFTASSPGLWGNDVTVAVSASPIGKDLYNFQVSCLDAKDKPVQQEAFQDVSLDSASDNYIYKVFEKSLLVTVDYSPAEAELPKGDADYNKESKEPNEEDEDIIEGNDDAPKPDPNPVPAQGLIEQFKAVAKDKPGIRLEGGCDHKEEAKLLESIGADLLKGNDGGPGNRNGLAALRDIADICIVVAPGVTDKSEIAEIVAHCELMGNRVCILDMPSDENNVTTLQQYRAQVDSSYAAMYHPWIQVFEPLEKKPVFMPPSGAMAGVYARTDNTRGVHKAPANENIRGCTGLQILFGKPEQDMLNPFGVNLIRNIQGQGIKVWGARTCSNDLNWKYINVRRLCIYIEQTIQRGIGWAVFEPNDALLWRKVGNSINAFLRAMWRDGALMGASEGEAFFVNIGKGSSMTDDDILNGRLICEIGIAPVRPAVFSIFRITKIVETGA